VLRLQVLRYFPRARLGPLWIQKGQLTLDPAEALSGVPGSVFLTKIVTDILSHGLWVLRSEYIIGSGGQLNFMTHQDNSTARPLLFTILNNNLSFFLKIISYNSNNTPTTSNITWITFPSKTNLSPIHPIHPLYLLLFPSLVESFQVRFNSGVRRTYEWRWSMRIKGSLLRKKSA
jgi:hypothetical protein